MTWIGGLRAPLTIVALLSVVVAVGCGEQQQELGPGERYARRFLPFDPQWIPESQVPSEPQKSPQMVIWEFSDTLEDPGAAEQKAASDWIERCYESALRHGWNDIQKAFADGYGPLMGDPAHYPNSDYMADGRILDPERPEFLMYYPLGDRKVLAGFMFITEDLSAKGPQFAGRLTLWHYHVWSVPRCVFDHVHTVGFAIHEGQTCARGEPNHRSPEMLHTWLLDRPQGPFATSMLLEPEVLGAAVKKRLAERGF